MREDMYKVIVERPRRGGSYSRDGRRFRASEDAPTKVGMRKGYGSLKYLNENLAPLRRYLERQAGRPWNLVFSDVVRKAWVSRITAASEEMYGRSCVYAVSKRQLGKRELHRFGLKDPGRDSRRRPSITPGKPGSHRKVSGLFCFRSGLLFNNADVAIASSAL